MATSLDNLAGLYDVQGQFAQAELIYKRALGLLEKSVPNHPDVATTLESMAELCTKMGRDTEAKKLLARAKRIQENQ